jgi:2-oxoglutarate dehydrogenase E1 component
MGAWPYLFRRLYKTALKGIDVISRRESSSTATGFAKQHANQQAYILAKALEISVTDDVKDIAKKATKKLVQID